MQTLWPQKVLIKLLLGVRQIIQVYGGLYVICNGINGTILF